MKEGSDQELGSLTGGGNEHPLCSGPCCHPSGSSPRTRAVPPQQLLLGSRCAMLCLLRKLVVEAV